MSMDHDIHRANKVDISKFTFDEPETNKYGGKSCTVKYDGKPFFIQTPRCRLPYCLGKYEEKDATGNVVKTKYSLDFSLAGYELNDDGTPVNPKMREFYECMVSLQDLLVKKTHENCDSWLDMPDATEGVAKALTRDLLKFSKDKQTKKVTTKWPPTVKARVGYWDGRFTLNAFNEDKERVEDLDAEIVPRTEAIGILKLTQVTFAGGKVGYSFSVHQVKLYAPKGMPSYAFIDDEDDNVPVVTGAAYDEGEDEEKEPNLLVKDSSSDADGDELDDESEADEAPPPPKKVVRRKKKD